MRYSRANTIIIYRIICKFEIITQLLTYKFGGKLTKILESDFKNCSKVSLSRGVFSFTGYKPFRIREKLSNYQSHAMIGGLAPSHTDKHRKSVSLLINILGGPAMNSRLNLSVRERYGYSYTIESNYTSFVDLIWYHTIMDSLVLNLVCYSP